MTTATLERLHDQVVARRADRPPPATKPRPVVAPALVTRNILAQFRAASPEHVAAGMEWYDLAYTACERLGRWHGYTATQATCALAHLSPRVGWLRNLTNLEALLSGEDKPAGTFTRSWEMAAHSLTVPDPLDTFSTRARKTRSFVKAILGDTNAVTVDIWTARAAGVEERSVSTSSGYIIVADAYRRASGHVGIPAREVQAITWCHLRGRAA